MRRYRNALPQLGDRLFVTDAGLETTLIYEGGFDLPAFAAFPLVEDAAGRVALRSYFEGYARLARRYELGVVLESPTWRANADWGARVGYDAAGLARANRLSIDMLRGVRELYEAPATPIVLSGNIGPRRDGYVPDRWMTAAQAYDYHAPQVETFAGTGADMVAAFTMNYVEEAIGIVKAAQCHAIPVAISFTLETDGGLPSEEALGDAIERTDAETGSYAAYYMINCAHPTHFAHVLAQSPAWCHRIRGLRANASTRSHAELDASTDLDAGDPQKLAIQYRALSEVLPLNVVGGCCGTDERHVERICSVLTAAAMAA